MKRLSLTLAAILTATLVLAADFPSLGIRESDAREHALQALVSGDVPFHLLSAKFKSASAEARVAMIETLLGWAKSYTATSDFRRRYLQFREDQRPADPAPATAGNSLSEMQNQIDELRKQAASSSGEQKKMMLEAAESLEKSIQAPEFRTALEDAQAANASEEAESHRNAIAQWEKDYPAEPKTLVASRLRQFLAESATVDFDAELVTSGSVKKFRKSEYEAKSSQWKAMYRAGKEPVTAARTFANAWLDELKAK